MLKARDSCPVILQHTAGDSDFDETSNGIDELRDELGPLKNRFNFADYSRSHSYHQSHRISYNKPRFLRRSIGSLPNITYNRWILD